MGKNITKTISPEEDNLLELIRNLGWGRVSMDMGEASMNVIVKNNGVPVMAEITIREIQKDVKLTK